MRSGVQGMVSRAADAASTPPKYADKFTTLAREMDGIVDKGYVIIGSPDEVAEQLREVAKNLNVGHLMMLLQFGNMAKDLAKYNTQLFAEQVMPQLHDVFADWRTAGGRSRWNTRRGQRFRDSSRQRWLPSSLKAMPTVYN